jgi:hypothetical protein
VRTWRGRLHARSRLLPSLGHQKVSDAAPAAAVAATYHTDLMDSRIACMHTRSDADDAGRPALRRDDAAVACMHGRAAGRNDRRTESAADQMTKIHARGRIIGGRWRRACPCAVGAVF